MPRLAAVLCARMSAVLRARLASVPRVRLAAVPRARLVRARLAAVLQTWLAAVPWVQPPAPTSSVAVRGSAGAARSLRHDALGVRAAEAAAVRQDHQVDCAHRRAAAAGHAVPRVRFAATSRAMAAALRHESPGVVGGEPATPNDHVSCSETSLHSCCSHGNATYPRRPAGTSRHPPASIAKRAQPPLDGMSWTLGDCADTLRLEPKWLQSGFARPVCGHSWPQSHLNASGSIKEYQIAPKLLAP